MAIATYFILAALCGLYAFGLEWFRQSPKRTYAPRWTWLTVVLGDGLVVLMAAVHLHWAGPPPLPPQELIWWTWWVVVYHFVWGGIPIIIWQEITDRRALLEALNSTIQGGGPK